MAGARIPFARSLKWRFECLVFLILASIIGAIPSTLAFWLGERIGALAWWLYPNRRNTVIRNLRVAFAHEKSLPEIHKLAHQSFLRAGANLISSCRTSTMSSAKLRKALIVQNEEVLMDALNQGSGVVLLIAHMGNWEVITRAPLLLPKHVKGGSFYRPLNNPFLDELILKRRQSDGARMFSKRDPFHEIIKYLRTSGVVGILADQRVAMQGDHVLFFNRNTRCSPLPALVAKRSKSPMVALSLSTVKPGQWCATFHPVQAPYNTQNCMAAVEHIMRTSPIDVFWLHDRWKVHLKKKITISDWLSDTSSLDPKPRRCLIWLTNSPENWTPPPAWFHPAVTYEAVIPANASIPTWLPPNCTIHHPHSLQSKKDYLTLIQTIDHQQALPIDFILSPQSVPHFLKKSARELTITIAAVA